MNRKILLIEPDYKNKYPPLGLMKLSTYFKKQGDEVRFFKGDIRRLIADIYSESLISDLQDLAPDIFWREFIISFQEFIRIGHNNILENVPGFKDEAIKNRMKEYRSKYIRRVYKREPFFDKVFITTLFTYNWNVTIRTVNTVKQLCKKQEDVYIGGIMSSILPDEVFSETGIRPFIGQLTDSSVIDPGTNDNIDNLPLDYSLLDETDYQYRAINAYYGYLTRGCPNKCPFCAVPTLEPDFCDYVAGLAESIRETDERFGKQRNLLLLDNNVLASECFDKIVDELVACGFGKDQKYIQPNQYDISIRNLGSSYNDRAYIKRCVLHYRELVSRLDDKKKTEVFIKLEEAHCLQEHTATKEKIIALNEYIRPLYKKIHDKKTHRSARRCVDFNQGIDAKLVTREKMQKLAEVHISPLRIAFDYWSERESYERAVRIAIECGVKNLSNYMLYNYADKPEDLYRRMRLNVYLCEELDTSIYSFPMKYHPISDPQFFRNRDYIGKYWNKKFIRAVQAVLNATKGKIGRGVDFFNEAFGENEAGYFKILWMPEPFIIYRFKYKETLTKDWWKAFNQLSVEDLVIVKGIISNNDFSNEIFDRNKATIRKVLEYYKI